MFFDYFFFKRKTAYEIRPGDWSSDVCSSDLGSDSSCTIVCPSDAEPLELLAAREVRRYVYLRTGRLLTIERAESELPHGSGARLRSEEHTSELQSRGLISYAVFC